MPELKFTPYKSRAGSRLPAVIITALLVTLTLVAMAGMAQAAQTGDTTFPASPWNGMQLTYTIQGATVGTPSDFTTGAMNRAADGQLTSRTLRVFGTWKLGDAGDGYNYQGAVDIFYHKNGDIKTPYTHLKTFLANGSDGNVADFDVQVDMPADATYITLEINETRFQDRVTDKNMYAQFTLQNPYYGGASQAGSSATPAAGTGTPTSAAVSPTGKAGGLIFGSPVVTLSLLLVCGFIATRVMRKKD
jgi:hypothetical protein